MTAAPFRKSARNLTQIFFLPRSIPSTSKQANSASRSKAQNKQRYLDHQPHNMPPLVEPRPTSNDNSLCHTEEVLTPSSTSSGPNFFDSIRKTPGSEPQKAEKNTEYVIINDEAPSSCPTAVNGKSCEQPIEREYSQRSQIDR